MSEWQPIESAPKDADALLLFEDGEGVHQGYWYDLDANDQYWVSAETQGLTGGRMNPTHWMPLPDPPSATGRSREGSTPPSEDDIDEAELFDGWTPEFTVYLVRNGHHWPMEVDCVFLDEESAKKRAALRGPEWWAMKYSGLVPPKTDPADALPSVPPVQDKHDDDDHTHRMTTRVENSSSFSSAIPPSQETKPKA
jgi:hypothetical protein